MRARRRVVCALLAFISMISPLVGSAPGASAQVEPTQLSSTTYYVVQGDSDLIAGPEADNEFTFLKILTFELPYDATRVHCSVPSDVRNLTTWVASKGLVNTSSGWETSGPMEGMLFVEVPSWFDRTSAGANTTNNSQSFLAAGSSLDSVVFGSGGLHLDAGAMTGVFTSAEIAVPENFGVVSANLTLYGRFLENVTPEVSSDHGLSWTPVSSGMETELSSGGSSLRVRLTINGNETDPLVSGYQVAFRYVPPSTAFTAHVSYIWTGHFEDGRLSLDLTEPVPYADGGSSFVWLYVERGYSVSGSGVGLRQDPDGDPGQPSKKVYVNMTLSLSGSPQRIVTIAEPQSDLRWLLVFSVCAVVVGVGGYFLRKRRAVPMDECDTDSAGIAEGPGEISEDAVGRKSELVGRKKAISAELEEIESKAAAGSLSAEEAAARSDALRTESKRIRNELNRVSRKAASSKPADSCTDADGSYESVLGSIARLDEDFVKGRLPESTYRSLRNDYKKKAASMLAAGGSAPSHASPLHGEKTKLLEAIVALDEEHARGQVDARVYKDLRATYGKELADVMRRIDAEKEE